MKNTDLSYYEIDNKLNFIKNQLQARLPEADITSFYADKTEYNKYKSRITGALNDKDFIDTTCKSYTNRVIRRLNRRYKELQQGHSRSASNYDYTILKILNLHDLKDVSTISKHRWQKSKIIWKQALYSNFTQVLASWQLNNWGKKFDNVLKSILKPRDDRLWVNAASLSDLLKFMELKFDLLLKKQLIEYLKILYLPVISQELSKILSDLNKQIPDILKIPELKRSSIPVGIDDGQVYRLNEIIENNAINTIKIKVSLLANEYQCTDLRTVDRYKELIKEGFKAQRGVLNFSRGKYFIYIPFAKKVSEERDSDLIASADLGLKTLATLSIYKRNIEVDRHFLDQKQLGARKTNWFKKAYKLNKLNLKGKLMDRRLFARQNQSIRMTSKKGTMRHWFAREREKTQWRKIRNIHKELIRQISTRIISYLNYYNVGTLVLENLKWSTHGKKSQSGYFLATWQVHWFYSQIQSMLSNQAKLHGIRVELVNPNNSSKICHRCDNKGNRASKHFYCTEKTCKLKHLDSDLNAARNLIHRSKKYRSLISDAIS